MKFILKEPPLIKGSRDKWTFLPIITFCYIYPKQNKTVTGKTKKAGGTCVCDNHIFR